MTATQHKIAEKFGYLHPKFDFPLSKITYFKLGGPAEVFVDALKTEDVIDLVTFCRQEKIEYRVIGGASNVIAQDQPLEGVVIRVSNNNYQLLPELLPDGRQIVRVGAGYKTALFVRQTIEDGLAGLEYFLGVPGTLGGAVLNNAHYLSDLIGEHVYRVGILTSENQVRWIPAVEADFGYDRSRFQTSGEVILEIEFALDHGDKQASMAKIAKATQYRATTQPLGEPSSGCIFQNVPNNEELRRLFPQFADQAFVPGGFLIDQAGLKGSKEGQIEVSQKHAAFFVNKGGGTAADVETLINRVKQQVKQQFGADLHEEVFYLR